jgi:hypothetical protein
MEFLPAVALNSPSATEHYGTSSGTVFGGELWITAVHPFANGLTLGARVGYIRIAQMQSLTYSESTPGYPLLKQYQRETRLRDTTAVVVGPSVGFRFQLGDIAAESRLYGAVASSDVNWMVGMDIGAEYPLLRSLGLRASFGIDLTSTSIAAPIGEVVPNSYTLGVRDVGTVPSALVSPALSLSLGIAYHP